MTFPIERIEAIIYTIRGQRVMLDSDLAKLYGVETKRLKEQVKRNQERFPSDFMFEPNISELSDLRSQIATLGAEDLIFKHSPFLFTENGVAMLSSVLHSRQAIQVNIAIMRTFTKLRSFLIMEKSLKDEVGSLKKDTEQLFRIVFERLDGLEAEITPKLPAHRKKIGLRRDKSS